MALTDLEKEVIVFIFNRDLIPLGPFSIAEFFDQTKATQISQLANRVQLVRDEVQARIDAHVVESAVRLNKLTAQLAVLDGLLAKLI